MKQPQMVMLFLAVLALVDARSVVDHSSHTSLSVKPVAKEEAKKSVQTAVTAKAQPPAAAAKPVAAAPAQTQKAPSSKAKAVSLINPEIKDVAGDKKFFGPPFPADYPDDKRPAVDKKILDKLKSADQPYPALQSKDHFDKDFVKDENSDTGSWKAQFEYDALRKKLSQEEGDVKSAQDAADKEGHDVDDAQKKADAASKDADAAGKAAADAAKGEDVKKSAGGADDAADVEVLPPSTENLEKLKKQVADAEAAYAKEQKDFEECKKQLEQAEANVKELKAKVAEMEEQLASQTKLWSETKTVRLNLHKAKVDAATAKKTAAEARLQVALNNKNNFDKILAKEKAESDKAQQRFLKEKADLEQAKKDLDKATVRLQTLRGYAPADAPIKSGSRMNSAMIFVTLAAMRILM